MALARNRQSEALEFLFLLAGQTFLYNARQIIVALAK